MKIEKNPMMDWLLVLGLLAGAGVGIYWYWFRKEHGLTVITDPATNTTGTAPVLHGTVGELGDNTSVKVGFDWGLTDTSQKDAVFTTVYQTVEVTAKNTKFQVALSNVPKGTYHFRARAEGIGGYVPDVEFLPDIQFGNDRTFVAGQEPTTQFAVATNAATSIEKTTAVLSGRLTGLGANPGAALSFEWGESATALSNTIAGTPAQGSVVPTDFTAALTGLSMSKTYYFRAKASSVATTVYGSPVSFTTKSPTAPVVTTLDATSVDTNQAQLMGNLTGVGEMTSISVWFQYGTTTAYGNTTSHAVLDSPGTFGNLLQGLQPNTTYHYRAVAGTTILGKIPLAFGGDKTFTTKSPMVPTVTTLEATSVTANQALLSGNLTSMGDYSNVDLWFIFGTTTNYGGAISYQAVSSPGGFNEWKQGLTPNTTYHYRAIAGINKAQVAYGDDKIFTTLGVATAVKASIAYIDFSPVATPAGTVVTIPVIIKNIGGTAGNCRAWATSSQVSFTSSSSWVWLEPGQESNYFGLSFTMPNQQVNYKIQAIHESNLGLPLVDQESQVFTILPASASRSFMVTVVDLSTSFVIRVDNYAEQKWYAWTNTYYTTNVTVDWPAGTTVSIFAWINYGNQTYLAGHGFAYGSVPEGALISIHGDTGQFEVLT